MAVDMFLKLDGIKGESKDDKHKDEIHIENFNRTMNQEGSRDQITGQVGHGRGKVVVHDICVTKFVEKSTPDLMYACVSGKHILNGLISVRKAGEKPLDYLKIKLVDIMITSVEEAGNEDEGDLMAETVTLSFNQFTVDYQEQDKDGSGKAAGSMGWDLVHHKKL